MNSPESIIIELLENNQQNQAKLLAFLKEINTYYPVPLTDKVDLIKYTQKVFTQGNVLAACSADKIVGAVIFYTNNYAEKMAAAPLIGVMRGYRQNLTGFKLARKGIEIIRERGMKSIYAFTHKENINALKFLQKLGFVIEPDRPTRYEYNVSLMFYYEKD